MSTSLRINIYPASTAFAAADQFAQMVKTVNSWMPFQHNWLEFGCGHGLFFDNVETSAKEPLSSNDVLSLLSRCKDRPQRWLSSRAEYNLWSYDNPTQSMEKVPWGIDVVAWASDSPYVTIRDLRIEGCAYLAANAEPYWALLDETSVPHGKEFNDLVADNLAELRLLIDAAVTSLKPRSIKLFDDGGRDFPWNSHYTYFDSYESVLRDLHLVEELWHKPSNYLKRPLSQFDPNIHYLAFSELRTSVQARELWDALNQFVGNVRRVTPDIIEEALQLTDLTVERSGEAFAIYGGRHYLNRFVQNFYVNVLELAS